MVIFCVICNGRARVSNQSLLQFEGLKSSHLFEIWPMKFSKATSICTHGSNLSKTIKSEQTQDYFTLWDHVAVLWNQWFDQAPCVFQAVRHNNCINGKVVKQNYIPRKSKCFIVEKTIENWCLLWEVKNQFSSFYQNLNILCFHLLLHVWSYESGHFEKYGSAENSL